MAKGDRIERDKDEMEDDTANRPEDIRGIADEEDEAFDEEEEEDEMEDLEEDEEEGIR